MKFLKLIFYTIAAAVVFTNCSKGKLNPVPQVNLLPDAAFSDLSRSTQEVNGLYAALKQGQMLAGRYMVYQDVRGEEFLNVTNNAVTAWLTWQHNVNASANEVQGFWGACYATINRCNVVIDGLTASPITVAQKTPLIAEARFVRAVSYFMLLQLYARPYTDGNGSNLGVILKLNPEITSGPNNQARSTVAQIYTQILLDLNAAETDLPAFYTSATNSTLNTTRAHKNTARAFKTRVYLNMGDWANTILEGNKLVPLAGPWNAPAGGVSNGLEANIANVFLPPYTTKESILSAPFTTLDIPGTQNGLGWYYNPGPNGGGEYELNLTGNGIAADANWRATLGPNGQPLDARRAFNIPGGARTYLRKWPKPANDADWSPIIRYAEVMLNLAEALARNAAGTTVDVRALAILNAIRQRSDPTHPGFTPADKNALVAAILHERRIELLGEGFRTSDVTRTGQSFAAKGTISAVAPATNQYIWPISIAELLVNTAAQQNPGY